MSRKLRNAIAHWALVVSVLALAGFSVADALDQGLRLEAVVLVLVTAALANLGLPMTRGASTLAPVASLMAYLTFGLPAGVWVTVVGLVLGGLALYIRTARKGDPQAVWWIDLGSALWPMAAHSLSLLAADFAYRELGASAPLATVTATAELLPLVAAGVSYLLVYNLLLSLDAWLAGRNVLTFYLDNRRVLLPVQVLPLPLAPLAAITLASLGGLGFVILSLALLTIGIVVNGLVAAQSRLRRQVRQLSSFSSVSQAVRTSLELNEVLETIYLQVAHLLNVEDFSVALQDPDTNQIHFPYVVRAGRREARPWRERGNTFVEWVMDSKHPLLVVDDVAQTAKRMGLSAPEGGLRTWMGVPLMTPDRTLGSMAVYTLDKNPKTFDEEDLELFGNLATQASVAVENALLYRDARQHARQLATLNEISAVMNASLDPNKVLDLLSSSIIQVADCEKTAIYLLEESDEPALQLAHSEGFSEKFPSLAESIRVPLSDAEREAVQETGKVTAVPDIREAADVSPGLVALAENEKFRAYANFPLRAHGHTIGLLGVYYNTPHRFQEAELELMQTFANQAALAVANARQYTVTDQALTRRVEQIVLLAEISRRLSATLDMDRIFHLVIDSALEASDAFAGMLLVTENENGRVRIGSWKGYPPDVIQRWQRRERADAQGISGRVLRTGQTALVADVSKDADYVNMGIGTKSLLSVPVVLDQEVMGVITLESDDDNAFSDDDVAFVSQLAVQAGVAFKNAQLYREVGEVNDRLHAILDASTDGLLMLDTQSRIVMTNSRMKDFWDFAREDAGDKSVEAFVADPLSGLGEGLGYGEGELSALVTQAVRSPDMPEQQDLYTVEEPKARFIERTTRAVRDEFGSTIGLLLVFRDITEQQQLEEARENLANMIVHDLRNPLTAVLASLALVNSTVAERDETGVAKQATGVSARAVRKLLVMVNNLLDLGRLEAGELTPELGPTGVNSIVENAVGEMLPLAMEMEVTITVESKDLDDLPDLYIDQDMIERVLLNLLDNGLKFSPPGSGVILRTELLEPEAEDDGADEDAEEEPQMVQIDVIDSGPGVPDEHKTRIFDRYQQVSGQQGRRRGTGLGLAFCRMAVEAHGGRIWVDDAPEGGSIFRLTLPVADEMAYLD